MRDTEGGNSLPLQKMGTEITITVYQPAKQNLTARAYDKSYPIAIIRNEEDGSTTDVMAEVVKSNSGEEYHTFRIGFFTEGTEYKKRTSTTNYHKAIGLAIAFNTK